MNFPNHAFAIKITIGSRKQLPTTYQELRLFTNTEVPAYPIKFVIVSSIATIDFFCNFSHNFKNLEG